MCMSWLLLIQNNNLHFSASLLAQKLRAACDAVRSIICISNIDTLKSIYYAYVHSIIKYGITTWVNCSNRGKIFTSQKKIIRIMAGAQPRTSRRSLFKQLKILPLTCQYILPSMNFFNNNQEIFPTNSSIHNINTRNKYHLHRPYANLSCYKKYILCRHKNFQQFTT